MFSSPSLYSVDDYRHCLERGRAASAKLSDFLRKHLHLKNKNYPSKLDNFRMVKGINEIEDQLNS